MSKKSKINLIHLNKHAGKNVLLDKIASYVQSQFYNLRSLKLLEIVLIYEIRHLPFIDRIY